MGLIKCIECGQLVSENAECCPNCGCPIEARHSHEQSVKQNVIVCPECGQEVSEHIDSCPNCGCPFEARPLQEQMPKQSTSCVCPECGKLIPESAESCPNCGCPVQTTVTEPTQAKVEKSKEQEFREKTSAEPAIMKDQGYGNNKHNTTMMTNNTQSSNRKGIVAVSIGVIIVVVGVLIALVYTFKNKPTDNYASQDLKTFGLKGYVKQCTLNGGSIGTLQSPVVINFTKDGMLENVTPDGSMPYTANYDENGRISEMHDTYRNSSIYFTYDESNRVREERVSSWCVTKLEYTYEGNTLKSCKEETEDEQGKTVSVRTLSFSEPDEHGNWTVCDVSHETTVYSVFNNNGDMEETDKQKGSYQVTRRIIYYSPDEISAVKTERAEENGSRAEQIYRQNIGKIKAMAEDNGNMTQYALMDLDRDGSEEFFITDNDVWYTSVFTLVDGEVKLVTKDAGAIKCVYGSLLKYGIPMSTWGAVVYCALDNGNIIEGLTDEYEKFSINGVNCTQEEFESFFSKFNGKERSLEWRPLSTLIN